MGVIDFYQGKNVLLTGTTGFLGKVMLERFLRCIPNVGRLYVLIRKKKGLNTMERFKKDILGSKCFDLVRKQNPHFDEMVNRIIRPVEGDLLKDGVGLSPEDYKELTENLHIIINCAASIDFNAALCDAIEINVFGTLRMFELAKQTKNLENFLHVSTAYVNSDKRGIIEEKIYDISVDAEKLIHDLSKLPKQLSPQELKEILSGFPNTYTFTKSMAERILQKKRGNVNLTILRPSIVGAAWREPCVGWIDSVSAASAIYLLTGIGVLKYLYADPKVISDQVPVDFIADSMIVAAATFANQNKLTIAHSTSSLKNPPIGGEAFSIIRSYFRAHPPEKRVGPCSIVIINNSTLLKAAKLMQTAPTKVYSKVAYTVGNANMRKNADKLQKMMLRSETISGLFSPFARNEWIFMTHSIDQMMNFCTPEERKTFFLDIKEVDWQKYYQYYAWGLHHYILGEKVAYPTGQSESMDLLGPLKDKTYVEDVKWALSHGSNFKPRSKTEIKGLVLSSTTVSDAIKDLVKNRKNKNISEEKQLQVLSQKANLFCERLMASYSPPAIKFSAWLINIIVRNMYDKIVVDENALKRLAQLNPATKGPIVLLPSHRSFFDFILISYIMFSYKMKVPHVGAYEEFLRMSLLPRIMRGAGVFFMKKQNSDSQDKELYNAILYEYLQRLLLEDCWLELFLEGSRSRYGKALPPNYDVLRVVTDAYFDKKVADIQLVPVTLNYDRVVEADTFPFELLGEEKLKLSTSKLLMSYNKYATKHFGKVFVKFGEPISLKEYTGKYLQHSTPTSETAEANQVIPLRPFEQKEHRGKLVQQLGLDLIRIINDHLIIMPTSLVASIILMHRKGLIEETLTKKMTWLIEEVVQRGGKLSTEFVQVAVKSAVTHLDNLLEKKKDIFHPSFSAKKDYQNILLLSYYRNMLGHLFFNEALIACSLASFGNELAWKEGVPVQRLWESTSFLQKLVGKEWFTWNKLNREHFDFLLDSMVQKGTFTLEDQKIKVAKKGQELVTYLCYLLWPFIETYWITGVFMFALKNRDDTTPFEKFTLEVQSFAESMYEERVLHYYEACSVDTIRNALTVYKERGLIGTQIKIAENTKLETEFVSLKVSEVQLKEIVDNIQRYLKNTIANAMEIPVDFAKGVWNDLTLAKL